MNWRDSFLLLAFILILANVLNLTIRLAIGVEVPDDLMTLSGQLLSWPPLVGLVSIGGGVEAIKALRGSNS